MSMRRALLALAFLAAACGKAPVQNAGAAPTAPSEALQVTPFERSILAPMLEDLRQGVRPVDGQAFGLCTTSTGKDCTEFLGATPGELPAGKYLVKAELAVPRAGDKGTWKATFEVKCTATAASGNTTSTNTNTYSHTYDVNYAAQERGYRLMPLYGVESPSKGGARSCIFTLTAPHPDGDKVYTGSWRVPAA